MTRRFGPRVGEFMNVCIGGSLEKKKEKRKGRFWEETILVVRSSWAKQRTIQQL